MACAWLEAGGEQQAISLSCKLCLSPSSNSEVLYQTATESRISLDAMLRDSDSRGALLLVFPAYVHSLLQVPLNVYVIMSVCWCCEL